MKIHSLIPVLTLTCICALTANAATTSHHKKPMKKQPTTVKVAAKPKADPKPLPTPTAIEPVGVSLSIDHSSYKVSDTAETPTLVHATLTVYNHTNQPIQFALKGTGYKWQILDDQKNLVWDSLFGKMLPHMVRLKTLTNDEMTFKSEITLQKQDGTALVPGQYTLHAELLGTPSYTAETAFTVK